MNKISLTKFGTKLSEIAGNMFMLAGSHHVGAAIHRQWIKDLRKIANEMEEEIANGKSRKRKN